MKKYIVTNFAYGTGPYLRTTELALAFNDELERRGQERLGIIVPWVYGEKQRKIMLEEFSLHVDEIFLDEKLGGMLGSIFYSDSTYEEALARWIENVKSVSEMAKIHLSQKFKTITLSGKVFKVNGKDIVLEINRSPRLRYDVAPSYFTTFGYLTQIFEAVRNVSKVKIILKRDLLDKAAEMANWVEDGQKIYAVAHPATFSGEKDYQKRYETEIITPPISRLYQSNSDEIEPGIFVTVTGVPGLERLYQDIKRLGLKIYSNDIKAVPNSIYAKPHVIPNKNMAFQFARSGWGSVWLSMISGTPLIVPDFDPKDDPEIYFNNLALEKLGIGVVYRGQALDNLLDRREELRKNCLDLRDKINLRWGTLDGNKYCAKIFAEDFINNL